MGGVEVKVGSGRGGFVRGIQVRNLTVEETNRGALVVMASYPERNPFCMERKPPAPEVSGITFEDIHIAGPTHGKLVLLQGTPEVFLKNVTVKNVRGDGTWLCSLVNGSAE